MHGLNRLGGNSLLDCVVFGRISGDQATAYLLQQILKQGGALGRANTLAGHLTGVSAVFSGAPVKVRRLCSCFSSSSPRPLTKTAGPGGPEDRANDL